MKLLTAFKQGTMLLLLRACCNELQYFPPVFLIDIEYIILFIILFFLLFVSVGSDPGLVHFYYRSVV